MGSNAGQGVCAGRRPPQLARSHRYVDALSLFCRFLFCPDQYLHWFPVSNEKVQGGTSNDCRRAWTGAGWRWWQKGRAQEQEEWPDEDLRAAAVGTASAAQV